MSAAALALFTRELVACDVSLHGRLVHATPALRKRLGVSARRAVDFLECIAIEDRARVQARLAARRPRGNVFLQCNCIGARSETFPAEIGLAASTFESEPVRRWC